MAWVNNMQKRGDVWWIRLRHEGTEIRRSTGKTTPEAARRWFLEFRNAMDAIEEGRAPAPTVAGLVSAWALAHARIHSKAHITRVTRDTRLYLIPKYGEFPADQFSAGDATQLREDFLSSTTAYGRPHTAAGANIILRNLRLIWHWGVVVGKLQKIGWAIPFLRVQRRPKLTVAADDVPRFLASVDASRNPQVGICVRAMLFLGLRESEALHMRWEWFGHGLKTYIPGKFIDDEFASKGGEADTLPVPEDLQARLRALTEGKVSPLSPWVLPAEDGKPHRPQFPKKAILRAGALVGVPGLTSHRLRGTCATLMARAGVDPFVIQQQMRHKDIKTTLRYVEVGAADLRDASDALMGRIGVPCPGAEARAASQAQPGAEKRGITKGITPRAPARKRGIKAG